MSTELGEHLENSWLWPQNTALQADGALLLGGVPASSLAETYCTPLYVWDVVDFKNRLQRAHSAFSNAFAAVGSAASLYYAGKAFLCLPLVRMLIHSGLRLDVCSGGELEVALRGGMPPENIGFHGNNKSDAELTQAVSAGVGVIVIDSLAEVQRVAAAANTLGSTAARGGKQRVRIRVSPAVETPTHKHLTTSGADQKFGLPPEAALEAALRVAEHKHLEFLGFHTHLGSQISVTAGSDGFLPSSPLAEALERLLDLQKAYAHRQTRQSPPPELNLGGGFAIPYRPEEPPTAWESLAEQLAQALASGCARRGLALPHMAFEPGRSLIGPSMVALYRVGTVKDVPLVEGGFRKYVSVDGGMSDNARPALYGATYSARVAARATTTPPSAAAPAAAPSRVVGKHCESGDILVEHQNLPENITPGDLLAIPASGAYHIPLASNYNFQPRPALVAVAAGRHREVLRRENIADMLIRERGIECLEGLMP